MRISYIRAQKVKKSFLKKRLFAVISLLLVAILMVSGVTYAWLILSSAPEVKDIKATVGANGNLEIALTSTEHLATLKANDMYDDDSNSEFTNGDLLHDNTLWGNMVDLNSSDYGLSTLDIRPVVLNVLNGCVADAPISVVEYGKDGRPEALTTDPNNPDIDTLGFTGVYNVNKGGYYAGSLNMSVDDLQNGNFDKEAVIQSILDNRDYGVRIAGLLDYSAGVNAEQTVANIDLMLDGYCFAVDMLFRTNAPNANLLLQTEGTQRVTAEDYEYLLDFSGDGSYLDMSEKKLSTAMRVVFADTVTGEVYALAQPDLYGRLWLTARIDENGNAVAVDPDEAQIIKPLTENQVSAITAWVYLDGMQVDNSYAATMANVAMNMNLQFATDIELTPGRPDGNGEVIRPGTTDEENAPADWIYYAKQDASGDYLIYTMGRNGARSYELPVTAEMNTADKTFLLKTVKSYPEIGVIIPSVVIGEDFSEYSVHLNGETTPFASLNTENASITFAAVKGKKVKLNSDSTSKLFTTDEATTFATLSVSALDTSAVTDMSETFRYMSSLVSVDISDWDATNVTNTEYMFFGCSALTSITIPESLTTIGDYAFFMCSTLTEATIHNNVTSVGNCAFDECTSLRSVTLGDSVAVIEDDLFCECSSLIAIHVGENNANYSSLDGVLFNKSQTTLLKCPEGKSGAYAIPDSVTTIVDSAFANCTSLQSVTIADSVTSIGEWAFTYCDSLKSVIIGNNVTTIENYAFHECSSLQSITIPDSVTSIGITVFAGCDSLISATIGNHVTIIQDSTFANCTSLTSISIPVGVTSIKEYALSGCDSLTDIYYGGSRNQWEAIHFGDYNGILNSVTIHFAVTD